MSAEAKAQQFERARKRLRKSLEKQGVKVVDIHGFPVHYMGKGDRFELKVNLEDSTTAYYEVTVYGPGRSYRIWEI